jgi:hypothetical protein
LYVILLVRKEGIFVTVEIIYAAIFLLESEICVNVDYGTGKNRKKSLGHDQIRNSFKNGGV